MSFDKISVTSVREEFVRTIENKILSGELEPTSGSVTLDPRRRMSVLKQNQSLYDDYTVLDAVIMGNPRLYACGKEKDAIYDKPDFSDEDGIRAAELEEEFAELGGWEAESDAGRILQGLGVDVSLHQNLMRDTDPRIKVKVLLAQALFGPLPVRSFTRSIPRALRKTSWEMLPSMFSPRRRRKLAFS
jgi:ATPase subunit of ABC transporter with duplicated ATPase domains